VNDLWKDRTELIFSRNTATETTLFRLVANQAKFINNVVFNQAHSHNAVSNSGHIV
jgi:hypothetical protein